MVTSHTTSHWRINSAIPKTAIGYSKAYREKGLMGNGDLQMLKMKVVTRDKETDEIIYSDIHYVGELICWNRAYTQNDVIKSFNDACEIGRKLVKQTSNHEEIMHYWLNNIEKFRERFSASIKSGAIPNTPRSSLNYYVRDVMLIDNEQIIKQEQFIYGE